MGRGIGGRSMDVISSGKFFGEFWVGISKAGVNKSQPIISDGRFGECYYGDSAGAREMAAELLAAADEYDRLAAGDE